MTGGDFQKLIETATKARLQSVAPFSNFLVGAALKTAGGKVYTGCNVESASYGLTVCAERVAIWKALSEGERDFTELAIVADTRRSDSAMWHLQTNHPRVLQKRAHRACESARRNAGVFHRGIVAACLRCAIPERWFEGTLVIFRVFRGSFFVPGWSHGLKGKRSTKYTKHSNKQPGFSLTPWL